MDIEVWSDGTLAWDGRRYRCSLGPAGVTSNKHEGDGATPEGVFALRRVLYRPDRVAVPVTKLPAAEIEPDAGWCDDPTDPSYNRQVALPHAGSCESLWREDDVYDLIVVLGHNDDPAVPGNGSAIFLHVARPGYIPTEGCVAVARTDLETILCGCDTDTRLRVHDRPAPRPDN